jgi:hypothetical protein
MRKIDLVHTTILIVAILTGYSAIVYLILALSTIANLSDFLYLRNSIGQRLAYYLVIAVLFAISCGILLKNGRKYALALLKDEPAGSWDDAVLWQLDQKHLLQVLFIGMGMYTLIQSVPFALDELYELFKDKIHPDPSKSMGGQKSSITIELIRIVFGAFLLYSAPALTRLFHKDNEDKSDADPAS